MTAPATTPCFEIVGGALPDRSIESLAALLIDLAEHEQDQDDQDARRPAQ